ncbi:uncharacterized protein LOC122814298 [Protopterus annectens]|uniref:uncharacterized protein LOC122814298 n=1 Tax=Protopterus annectens TaxID=7888 RepID=UPI001CFBE90C|nr:uncharacterized protein LOC122814298 [Protopterus annectens]
MYKTRQRSERRKEQPKKKTTFKAGCKHKIEMIPRLDVGLFLSVSFSITEVPVCIKGTNFLASGKILIVFNTPSECSKKVDVTRLQDQLYMEFYIPLGITQTSTLIIGLASRISSIPLDVPETEAFISWIISMISKIPSDLKTPAAFVLGRVFFKYVAPKEPEEANEPESKPEPKEESDGEEMDPFCRLNMLLHKVPACLRVDPFLIKGLDGQHFLVSAADY